MENYCPPQLSLIENYAIMDQPRIEHYKKEFADPSREKHCMIIFDESNIEIDSLDNFPGHYEPRTDIYFANPGRRHATTYMVKGVFTGWWFIIQFIFHSTFTQETLAKELDDINNFIVQHFQLQPVVYLGDMACKS
jgi:hypothetical protein